MNQLLLNLTEGIGQTHAKEFTRWLHFNVEKLGKKITDPDLSEFLTAQGYGITMQKTPGLIGRNDLGSVKYSFEKNGIVISQLKINFTLKP